MKYSVSTSDKFVSALTYITLGWAGIIYLIYLYFRKKSSTRFVRFNTIQAIFLTLLVVVLSMFFRLILGLLAMVPIIQILVAHIEFIFNRPILFDYSFIQLCITVLMAYTVIMSLMGKYPKIYKISEILEKSA